MPKCTCGGKYLVDKCDDLGDQIALAMKCTGCSFIVIMFLSWKWKIGAKVYN